MTHYFPMKKIHMGRRPDAEVEEAWQKAAGLIVDRLSSGLDVVFPTLGDPAIYSTGFYVCETLLDMEPGIHMEIIPGVSSIGASAAAAGQPLCLGDDRLVVIPATFENGYLREILLTFDTVVLMKVHRVMKRIVGLLAELDLLEKAVLVERSSQNRQRVSRNLTDCLDQETHYFSTVIVRK
jgi:precorrin-2/cobalt-factor-2 C20-methyltransferase